MNIDGGGQTRLTFTADVSEWYPLWSGDSSKIIYQGFTENSAGIYVMDIGGNGQTYLADSTSWDVSYSSGN